MVVLNFSTKLLEGMKLGCADRTVLHEILNSDDVRWGGSGVTNPAPLASFPIPCHGSPSTVRLHLAPLFCRRVCPFQLSGSRAGEGMDRSPAAAI